MLTRERLDQFLPIDAIAYFDTLRIWIARPLVLHERDTLESLCGGLQCRSPTEDHNYWMQHLGFKEQLILQQPSLGALKFLDEQLYRLIRPRINRVDCALDLTTHSKIAARELQNYIDARWYKPYHRPRHEVKVFEDETTYLGFKARHTKYTSYSSRPCRIGARVPCCHLECRFNSQRTVRSLGIKAVSDLRRFDHANFWRERLRLFEYEAERVGKLWNKRRLNGPPLFTGSDKWRRNHDLWTGNVLCRRLQIAEDMENPVLMDLYARFAQRGLNLQRILRPVDVSPLLMDIKTMEV